MLEAAKAVAANSECAAMDLAITFDLPGLFHTKLPFKCAYLRTVKLSTSTFPHILAL